MEVHLPHPYYFLWLGLNDAQPLFTCWNVGNQLLEYIGIFTLAWHLRCPGGYASSYRVHHPNVTLTTSRGPNPGNYVS
jgi:hypothetical protein